MLECIRGKCRARRVAKWVKRELLTDPEKWSCTYLAGGVYTVQSEHWHITITARTLRIFDRIQLWYKEGDGAHGIEITLPILSRLRLRSCVRYFAATKALSHCWYEDILGNAGLDVQE